jgi:hypothetical protein
MLFSASPDYAPGNDRFPARPGRAIKLTDYKSAGSGVSLKNDPYDR